MPSIEDLTYGPMVAHTTSTSFRIWLRAGKELRGQNTSVICILMDGTNIQETQTFNFLSENYDYVALIEFGTLNHLTPDTSYHYVIEYMNEQGQAIKLPKGKGTVKTFSNNIKKEISFVTGSCRHLYVKGWKERFKHIFGNDDLKATQYGDLVFKQIAINKDFNPDFMLMTGDQVYADHAEGAFLKRGSAVSIEEFLTHYHRAWGQEHFSNLSKKIPFYMTMDDHELINDFRADMIVEGLYPNQEVTLEENRKKYTNGLKSYLCYQASLSSVIKSPENLEDELEILGKTTYEKSLNIENDPYRDHSKNLHYQFSHGCAEFYSMDVRTERYLKIKNPQMIGQSQMNDLEEWLSNTPKDKVKFIITAVPIFPDTQRVFGAPEDKWGGFAEQRHKLLDFIRNKEIEKVVFLSGDVHVSFVAELQYEDDRGELTDTGIFSIISSAFTWPVLGLSRYNFSWNNLAIKSKPVGKWFSNKIKKRIPDTSAEARSRYIPKQISKRWRLIDAPHANNSYCNIKTDGNSLTYSFYSRDKNEMYDGGDNHKIIFKKQVELE